MGDAVCIQCSKPPLPEAVHLDQIAGNVNEKTVSDPATFHMRKHVVCSN